MSATSESTEAEGKAPATFFDLPPELRNRVYELTLKGGRPVFVVRRGDTKKIETYRSVYSLDPQYFEPSSTAAGLLRASHQVYQEAVAVLYDANRYILNSLSVAQLWYNRIGRSIVHIRYIELDFLEFADYMWRLGHGHYFFPKFKQWITVIGEARSLQVLGIPYMRYQDEPQYNERSMARLLMPLCLQVAKKRRAQNADCSTTELLSFLDFSNSYLRAPIELDVGIRNILTTMLEERLRTPEQEDTEEEQVLEAVQMMFEKGLDEAED